MNCQLHILTEPPDKRVEWILEALRELPDSRVLRFDLTVDEPDYDALLDLIFESNSVMIL